MLASSAVVRYHSEAHSRRMNARFCTGSAEGHKKQGKNDRRRLVPSN